MTDSTGALKGVTWQVCPTGFIYRRSIAKDVLGTEDPVEVQAAIDSWGKFDEVAIQAKEKGYYMLSGFDDTYRIYSNNVSTPWVIDEKIIVNDELKSWVVQTKKYTDMGYNNQANLWSPESGLGARTNVFGYFGPGWFIDSYLLGCTLEDATVLDDDSKVKPAVGNGTYGDWGLCKGPQGSFWGGIWFCAAAGTDNIETIKEVMYTLTCDKDILLKIAQDKGDFANNVVVMEKIANGNYSHPFLGGQNHISAYLESATAISMNHILPYDQGLNKEFQEAMMEYYKGGVLEEAYQNFYDAAIEKYPNLTY
jgi:hypothetical protein